MNAKSLAATADEVTSDRMGAIQRRLSRKSSPLPQQPKKDENDDLINSRKSVGY